MSIAFLKKAVLGLTLSAVFALASSAIGFALAAPAHTTKAQETCPVMGGKISRKVFVDYKGKRVYFCCPGCIGKFQQDPEKYIKDLESKGVQLEDAPAK